MGLRGKSFAKGSPPGTEGQSLEGFTTHGLKWELRSRNGLGLGCELASAAVPETIFYEAIFYVDARPVLVSLTGRRGMDRMKWGCSCVC